MPARMTTSPTTLMWAVRDHTQFQEEKKKQAGKKTREAYSGKPQGGGHYRYKGKFSLRWRRENRRKGTGSV